MSFSKCSSRPHFSYIFCLASTCYENSDPPRLTNISQIQFLHIFPTFFHCFYVSATRLQFCKVTKKVHALLRHDALEGAHVREMTLCVTFGAPPFGERFRRFTRCFKYVVFHMVSGTHVRRTTLCVTFGARGRSILLGLLDHPLGHLDHQIGPGTSERPCLASVWAPTSPQDDFRTLPRHARDYIQTSGRVSSVDGSAMHMKWPDGIGREAGIGRTRRGQELSVFRACP